MLEKKNTKMKRKRNMFETNETEKRMTKLDYVELSLSEQMR
jgi:hypothetical protein